MGVNREVAEKIIEAENRRDRAFEGVMTGTHTGLFQAGGATVPATGGRLELRFMGIGKGPRWPMHVFPGVLRPTPGDDAAWADAAGATD